MEKTETETEKDNIEVVIRIRPLDTREKAHGGKKCITIASDTALILDAKPEPKIYNFDLIGDENYSQE
jgi:hypothetical protein